MNRQRQDSWTSIKKWLCYSGHRVALVVHRAQKSVPDSAGEWPTFLPPPLESCSGTANVDGPKESYTWKGCLHIHYSDVTMGTTASQISSLTIVYSTVYSGTDQRKHQSSASLAFVRGIYRWPVNSPHKWPVTRKMFPFDDVIMLKHGRGFLSPSLVTRR